MLSHMFPLENGVGLELDFFVTVGFSWCNTTFVTEVIKRYSVCAIVKSKEGLRKHHQSSSAGKPFPTPNELISRERWIN